MTCWRLTFWRSCVVATSLFRRRQPSNDAVPTPWLPRNAAIASRIAGRIDPQSRVRLLSLLSETVDGRITRFVWLRQFEAGSNSNEMNILIEVDEKLHFTDAFNDLRTGIACGDRIGVLTVLLADGVNLGLRKMADASDTHTFWELLQIGKWHVRDETTARALAIIVEAQSKLPMARFWGDGTTLSSDGQHFPAGSTGEALNVVNAR